MTKAQLFIHAAQKGDCPAFVGISESTVYNIECT